MATKTKKAAATKSGFTKEFTTYSIVLMAVAIGINIGAGQIPRLVGLPLYLDSDRALPSSHRLGGRGCHYRRASRRVWQSRLDEGMG